MTATGGTLRQTAPFLPVGAALFCVQLDFFSLTLALPTIADDLRTTVTDLQWLLSGYMIALGSLLIPGGRAGDVLGRRTVLLLGVGLFGLTSLVCGLASSVPVLIAARIAQGAGAAMIMPTAFALVTNATSEEVRPRVTGALLGIAGVGTALGPVVGGGARLDRRVALGVPAQRAHRGVGDLGWGAAHQLPGRGGATDACRARLVGRRHCRRGAGSCEHRDR
jgi:MFS family permease